jgi:AmmeMemoRadiSam system protein B/AmmeMemoRadiSam system protein A
MATRRPTPRPSTFASALRLAVPLLAAMVALGVSCKRQGQSAPAPTSAQTVAAGRSREVRPPAVAGQFYPADKDELAAMVRRFLAAAKPKNLPKPVIALIVPHAGYPFSGQVAAYGFKALEGRKVQTVVLIGNSHAARFDGAAVADAAAFATPLGEVRVDEELVGALLKSGSPFESIPRVHAVEHSLEVELPFLQEVLGDFRIVPILLGEETQRLTGAVAEGLAKALQGRPDAIIVCSTDLSHYPPYEQAQRSDNELIDAVLTLDEFRVRQTNDRLLQEGIAGLDCTACGLGAMLATLGAAKRLGADSATLLKYANSGDVEGIGDRERVVGYGAIALCGEAGTMTHEGEKRSHEAADGGGLDEAQQGTLLKIARESVTAAVRGQKPPQWDVDDPALKRRCGAFVTLKERGELRGCIGYIEAIKPLFQTVADVAASAALNDPRFMPVSPEELPDLTLEISVLTPLRRLTDPAEIVIGKHGLLIRKGGYQGLLLPQVATEWGWDKWQFLEHTCRKAGLPPDAWKDPQAEIYTFTAQVFGEEK